MITYIKGIVAEKKLDRVTIEARGIGYEILIPESALESFPQTGDQLKLFISESSSMYGGNVTWYGFVSQEERHIFETLKSVSKIGSKGALDILSKIQKGVILFAKSIREKDSKTLTSYFGFTKKTAEKLILGLKDKIEIFVIPNSTLDSEIDSTQQTVDSTVMIDAVQALISLGYKESSARKTIKEIFTDKNLKISKVEDAVTYALRSIAR
ncbi:Holliday junction branch migration protein RuvA [bacterium]